MIGNKPSLRIQYPVAQPFLKSILSVKQYPYEFLLVLQINIDFQTKNSIAQSIEEATHTCFSAAQKRVYSLMENNSYPRFLESEFYQELCRKSPISRDSQETWTHKAGRGRKIQRINLPNEGKRTMCLCWLSGSDELNAKDICPNGNLQLFSWWNYSWLGQTSKLPY